VKIFFPTVTAGYIFILSCLPQIQAQSPLPNGIHTLYLPDAVEHQSKTIPVDIFIGDSNYQKNILVLPGWNFSRKRWLQETSLQQEALKRHYNLILPEMGITIYESKYYNETKRKWATTPGSEWIKQILIPKMQKQGLLLSHQFNTVMGLSTGGRGAVLTALYNKHIFKACASLSGDYNQATMPNDKLMTATYGPYFQFKDRWEKEDNPYSMIDGWDIPLYLGHGTKDTVVPFDQTKAFYEKLKSQKPDITIKYSDPECGHDFKYWSSEVVPILNFFDAIYAHAGEQQ